MRVVVWFWYIASPQQGDLRLLGLPSGRVLVAGLEPATEGSVRISGRTYKPLCHRRPDEGGDDDDDTMTMITKGSQRKKSTRSNYVCLKSSICQYITLASKPIPSLPFHHRAEPAMRSNIIDGRANISCESIYSFVCPAKNNRVYMNLINLFK
ncbi:hypothetical protein PoB_002436400 [Plakobranchus ocellatus]|uniref:Uncharacterized protein n=1 Tax=Plakobranchus ocellatus TaxID=259542 RepID=A0AAV3ZR94_9GAST|nr:hypothetical protein PoB_002436400 [Plakobranchus ocellatus]